MRIIERMDNGKKAIDDILMFLIGHWQSQKMLIETYDNPQRVNFVIFDFY